MTIRVTHESSRIWCKDFVVPVYAAYGSNMDSARMAERCPHSPSRGSGWLEGWRLTFGGEDIGWEGALATVVGLAFARVVPAATGGVPVAPLVTVAFVRELEMTGGGVVPTPLGCHRASAVETLDIVADRFTAERH